MSFRPRSSKLETWIEQHNSVQTASFDPKSCENITLQIFILIKLEIENLLKKLPFFENLYFHFHIYDAPSKSLMQMKFSEISILLYINKELKSGVFTEF